MIQLGATVSWLTHHARYLLTPMVTTEYCVRIHLAVRANYGHLPPTRRAFIRVSLMERRPEIVLLSISFRLLSLRSDEIERWTFLRRETFRVRGNVF